MPVVSAGCPWAGSFTSLSASFLLEIGNTDPDVTDCPEKEWRKGMWRVSAWPAVASPRACPYMAWVSSGQRQRIYPCLHIVQELDIPGKPRLYFQLLQRLLDLPWTPRLTATQDSVSLLGGQLYDQQAPQSPLRIQPTQLVLAWLGPAGHLVPTPLSVPVFASLWVLLIFHGLHQRQKEECCFLQGESRRWKEGGG